MEMIWIVANPRVAATGELATVRMAGGGNSAPFLRDGEHYMAGLVRRPRFTAKLDFGDDGWTGRTVPTTAAIAVKPARKAAIDALGQLYWKDAAIEVEVGPEGGPWTRLLTGTVKDGGATREGISLEIADLSVAIDKPVCPGTFAGTGGAEGGTEAKGRIKRRSWGGVFNVEGRVLDKANNIYEFGDPAHPLSEITTLRDMGRDADPAPDVLAWQGTVADTLTALAAAACADGSGVVAPSIACAKWWTQPAGPLTADLKGEVGAGYVETVPEIAERIVQAMVGPAVANVAAMAALRPDPAGLHIGDGNETAAAALDRLLLGVSLLWVLEPAGTIRLREWTFTGPVASLRSRSASRKKLIAPTKTRRIGWLRSHRLHGDGEISAAVLAGDVEGLGDLAIKDYVTVNGGGSIRRADLSPIDEPHVITALGTAAAIVGQKSGATTQITRAASAPGSPAAGDQWIDTGFTPNRLMTWSGSAWVTATPSQGTDVGVENGATAGATYGIDIDALPASIDPGNILAGGFLDANQMKYGAGGPLVVSLQPAEAGANVTATHISAGITGQAATATSSDFAVITGATKPEGNATRNPPDDASEQRNSSFEVWSGGAPLGWTVSGVTEITANARRGIKVARLTGGSSFVRGETFPVTAGERRYASAGFATIVNDSAGSSPGTASWYVVLRYYDSAGAFLSDGAIFTGTINAAAGYQELNGLPLIVPANARNAQLLAVFESGDGASDAVGEIDFLTVSRAEPGASFGATAGLNTFRGDGVTVMSQAEIRTPEGTAAAIAGQAPAATDSSIEAGADVTSVIEGLSDIIIKCDHTGAPLTGQLTRSEQFRLIRNGSVVTSGITWTYTVLSGGINGVTSASGAQAISGGGAVFLDTASVQNAETRVEISAVKGSVTRKKVVGVRKENAPPPTGGSSGGGSSASDFSFASFNSTSMAVISDELVLTTGSSATSVALVANLTIDSAGTAAGGETYAIFQWWNGSAWVDVGSEVASDPDLSRFNEPPWQTGQTGEIAINTSKTGLSSSTEYKFRLLARRSSGASAITYTVTGSCSATG